MHKNAQPGVGFHDNKYCYENAGDRNEFAISCCQDYLDKANQAISWCQYVGQLLSLLNQSHLKKWVSCFSICLHLIFEVKHMNLLLKFICTLEDYCGVGCSLDTNFLHVHNHLSKS
jgi:hypothetical protein